MTKNWFGMEPHPSDSVIHWTEPRFANGKPDPKFVQEVEKLRAAWDLLHSTPELKAAYELLSQKVRDKAEGDQADIDAGEDL